MNKCNRTINLIVACTVITLLTACSSQPIVISQYLLNVSEPELSKSRHTNNDISVLITDISLPEYLKNRSLVMQRSNGQLSVATKHVWAQPMDSDFGTALANSLSRNAGYTAYYAPQATTVLQSTAANADVKLAIAIEHFMPLDSGNVVLSGHWQMSVDSALAPKRFDLVLPMTADGYAHSVDRMRALIKSLSTLIKEEIEVHSASG